MTDGPERAHRSEPSEIAGRDRTPTSTSPIRSTARRSGIGASSCPSSAPVPEPTPDEGPPLRRRPLGPQRALPRADPPRSTTRSTSTGSASSGRASSTCPKTGGALLVANHAGAIPPDAPSIMHGIEKELGRPVYGLAENLFRTMPVVGTLWSRSGGVAAHPDNAYRLLHDEEQLVLVFPEGTKGTGKLYTRALPAAPLRARRLRRDRDARGRAGHPDRGRRRRRGDADPVQEQPAREGARTSRTSRSPRTCSRSGPLGLVGVLPREVPDPRAAARALRRRARTRSATRAAA